MKKITPFASIVILAVGLYSCSTPSTTNNDPILKVKTANGIVEGVLDSSGIHSFKGIPYAAPPIGDLRWREPQPVKNWDSVLVADHFGPQAMQTHIFSDMVFRSAGTSEDCLYLNVWTPAKSDTARLPVLVYFYGGGFVAGDGSEYRYDGESMAQKGVVTLTVNYRLGIFGFFSHPELTKESPNHASGDYGLLDQAAALNWVHENISAFGGDPGKVTIAGESAGSVSVSALMASPLSKNLIAGAIGESGSILGALPAVPLSQGEAAGLDFAKSVGANSLADLRAMNADTLLARSMKYGPFRFPRTIDGYFFPKSPDSIFSAGEQADVPLLAGRNSEEGSYHNILQDQKPTVKNYEAAVRKMFGVQAGIILKAYHPANDAEVPAVGDALASDRFIAHSTRKWAVMQIKTGTKPVYYYYYSHPRPKMNPDPKDSTAAMRPPAEGAVHSAEIEYAMGNLSTNKVYAWNDDDYKISKLMENYFANFIKNGNPNGPGLPEWPAANRDSTFVWMHIDVDSHAEPDPHPERYQAMEEALKTR